jgi:ADP-ribose pyrophosphatase YjhB (NUDIX family)
MTPPRPSGAGNGPRPAAAGEGSDPKTWPVRNAASYGGVVVREGPDGPEVALIRPQSAENKQVWALPKGGKEEGERPEEAALREVREETGISAELVDKIDSVTYWFAWAPERVRYKKTVHFFLMRSRGGEPTPDGVEVAEVRFFPVDDAPTKATYPSERKVLKLVADRVRSESHRPVQS